MFTKEDVLGIKAMQKRHEYMSIPWWKFRLRAEKRKEFLSVAELAMNYTKEKNRSK